MTKSREGSTELKVPRPHQPMLRKVLAEPFSMMPGTESETPGSAVSLEGIVRIIYRWRVSNACTRKQLALAGTLQIFQSRF